MSRVEFDEDDTAELAAVVLDREELVRRRDKKLESLYKLIQSRNKDPYNDFYRCLVCKPNEGWLGRKDGDEKYLIHMKTHIMKEHFDKIVEVDSEMRREVLARKKANHGVEDPVYWEEYYRTNCKLRRPV